MSCWGAFRVEAFVAGALGGIGLPEEVGRLAAFDIEGAVWVGVLVWPLVEATRVLGGLACWP